MSSPAKYRPCTSFEAIVRGSISFVLTPPRVIMASSTGRVPEMGITKRFVSSSRARRCCLVRELARSAGSMPGAPQQHGDHGVREEVCQRILHAAVGIGLEIAQEARIKLSLVQRRLQIEHEGIGLPRLQMRRGRQDRRPETPKCVNSSSPKS